MTKLGDKIKKLRTQKGMTQDDLAAAIGTTKASISYYERNKRNPQYPVICAMAKVLGVPESELLSYASKDEEMPVENQIDSKRSRRVKKLLSAFDRLSDEAQLIALERIEELCLIPKYQQTLPDALQRLLFNRYQLSYETIDDIVTKETYEGNPLTTYIRHIVLQQRLAVEDRIRWHCLYYSGDGSIYTDQALEETKITLEKGCNLAYVFDDRSFLNNFYRYHIKTFSQDKARGLDTKPLERTILYVLVEKNTWVVQEVRDFNPDDYKYPIQAITVPAISPLKL